MFDKYKRKLWKSLTKSIIKDSTIQQRIYTLEWEASSLNQVYSEYEAPREERENVRILCTGGYIYSGSSAIIGLLNEFDNVSAIGYSEPSWSKSTVKSIPSECGFFNYSHFLEMLDSFHKGNLMEQNFAIIKFIQITHQAYETKRACSYEYMPLLYNEEFREICQELLLALLELDDATRATVKRKGFPFNLIPSDFNHCNFVIGEGKQRYLFYRFAHLSDEELHGIAENFLNRFFRIINGKSIIAFDQLVLSNRLEKLNRYLAIPAKQVCVYRDPRDRFISAHKSGFYFAPNAKEYVEAYRKALASTPPYEHRLMVRFEDLVLRYDETVQKVIQFFRLDPQNHVAPKSVFDPAISVANIGAWHSYVDQDLMHEIEELMGDYCYYPERENLSEESLALLRSSGNWNLK